MDWLRPLLMMFYAPSRAVTEARDHAPLAPSAFVALVAQGLFIFLVLWFYVREAFSFGRLALVVSVLLQSAGWLLLLALVFVPVALLVINLFEQRASYGIVLRQEYAATASVVFYAWAAASVTALVAVLLAAVTGLQAAVSSRFIEKLLERQSQMPPEMLRQLDPRIFNPNGISAAFSVILLMAVFALWSVVALREAFRLSTARAVLAVTASGIVMFPSLLLMPVVSTILGSPFLLLMLFILLRGYFSEVSRAQQARAAFKRNLEAATLNPADASAHYNLGLIHQQRGELDEARERFERAVEIDPDEGDAHYQLGRIARAQGRLADAIKNFEQVVGRDQSHAQHEIWREIGATYLAAGQFADARDALERFLEHRRSDPQGLYLMGRALAGMGRQREAAEQMQACIEAVKTAPAYKYKTEKRWLNEAQQFLRTQT